MRQEQVEAEKRSKLVKEKLLINKKLQPAEDSDSIPVTKVWPARYHKYQD